MSATPIQNAQAGEDLLGIEPALLQQVDPGWLHRLNLFNGRALTATALQSEQLYRAGRLAILGQSVTQGIVKGLVLSANLTAADPLLQVTPGYGISASGEDVTLLRTLRTTLSQLLVIDPSTGLVIDTFPNYSKDAGHTAFAGVLLLQPITGQVSGSSVDTGGVSQFVSGNLSASCDQDPSEDAVADWQIVDGVRLVLVAWPASLATVASTDPAYRNKLVYTVFNAEMALAPDDRLPWDMLGVPVALMGFDNTWKPLFVDRSAVVRTGGLARNRYVLPASPGLAGAFLLAEPALAQARVSQLTEQLAATPGLTSLVPAFASLPPCGVLPARSMDFTKQVGLWFPSNWTLTVGPVRQEEIETTLLAGMTARPLDPTQNESVEVQVPLPDTLYDPDILITETVDPSFQKAVTDAQDELTFVLQHRQTIQEEANALSLALNGRRQRRLYFETAGLTQIEINLLGPALTVGPHSITAVFTDVSNVSSTSAALTQTVSNVMLSSSANPMLPGEPLTLTAGLPSLSATGNIQFMDGATQLGAPMPLIGGIATLVVASMTPGAHAITAMYPGDAHNPSSISPVLVETVSPTPTNVVLKPSANPSPVGQAMTLTVSVSPSTATGNVQFLDGGALLTSVALSGGTATFTTASLSPGTHYLTASYAGDKSNPAGNSAVVVQRISPAAATVTLSVSANPSVVGQGITFTASVTPGSAAGSVQFMNGTAPLGPPVQVSANVATLAVFETFGTAPAPGGGYASQDYRKLITDAGNPPYTLFQDGNGTPLSQPLPLFNQDDLNDLAQYGIQHFIGRINAKIAKANDLVDLAFLTTQSDIYRFRQYVLGASDATALAVSPIAAQISTGESAAVTASNLQSYLSSTLPSNSPNVPPTTTTPKPGTAPIPAAPAGVTATVSRALLLPTLRPASTVNAPSSQGQIMLPSRTVGIEALPKVESTVVRSTVVAPSAVRISPTEISKALVTAPGTVENPASTTDVLWESPLVGAQLNLRTLTIAQRLANPPSQEGLFYATANRVALLQLLADLEIVIDDLPILVDTFAPPATTTAAPGVVPPTTTLPPGVAPSVLPPTVAAIRSKADPNLRNAVYEAVLSPTITPAANSEADEATLFSTGIHVLEQHSALLRAIEGRIQQYSDFVTECATAQSKIQGYLPQTQTLLTQLENDLAQARQDVAFTTALLSDETVRVAGVNLQRSNTLQKYVQAVVYTRPRTLQPTADVPSRQLVPGNIQSPVPTCRQQSGPIPPELRETVALLRDAPVSWLPAIQALLIKLERIAWLEALAEDLQSRALAQLALPLRTSSAASEPGVYAPVIASIYSADQQAMRAYQTQRAAFQAAQLANLSWAAQVTALQGIASPGDLLYSEAVHAEVVNATSRLLQQISNVATCLYARACQALPIDRLAWAEFLMGPGLSIQLSSLAVLPNWNTQDYVTRQQTQMLVDWLFLQIDTSVPAAVAFMSDVVRVSILLASDAPVNTVIAGAVTLATTPTIGSVVRLTLPSDRIAQGMYVQLYSSGTLAAQALVSDLDSASVQATVTQVYQPGVALQANDLAHFTAQPLEAAAIQAFDT